MGSEIYVYIHSSVYIVYRKDNTLDVYGMREVFVNHLLGYAVRHANKKSGCQNSKKKRRRNEKTFHCNIAYIQLRHFL